MNEEIEYAEMLEIPVSTVNVVRKKRARKRKAEKPSVQPFAPDLKESVIAQVNDKLLEGQAQSEENALQGADDYGAGNVDFNDIPERIDTVRLYSTREKSAQREGEPLSAQDYALYGEDFENDGGRYATKRETRAEKRVRFVLGAEFAVACALCGAIFLTNVFVPESAINTFFRALDGKGQQTTADNRTYADFTLSSVVSALSDAELTLSPTGILSFTDECCVYPTADGKVSEITQNADGTYTLKIAHSETFTGVIGGLDEVYYQEGDAVKANVPVGYTTGEAEVQVTMYSSGVLLNCFELTEENCLAWVVQE